MRSEKIIRLSAAAAAGLLATTVAQAAPLAPSIGINFASDENDGGTPAGTTHNGSTVSGSAGVLGTTQWNNTTGGTGTGIALIRDTAGVSGATSATVSYTASAGTWASDNRGEDNNDAPEGNNRHLMLGYLDTTGDAASTVTITGLNSALGGGPYQVYVYHNGGVIGRGGTYAVSSSTTPTQTYTDSAIFSGTFVPNEDFQVFTVPAGTNSITVTATPTIGTPARAPINGIEVVGAPIPEPASLGLLGVGALGLLGRRRRRA